MSKHDPNDTMICICGACKGTGKVAVPRIPDRVEPQSPPTLRDRIARVIADFESMAPGRLCVLRGDDNLAGEIVALLERNIAGAKA